MAVTSFKSGLSKSPSIKCFKYDCSADEFERAFGIEHGAAGRGIEKESKEFIKLNRDVSEECFKIKFHDDKKDDSIKINQEII